MPETQGLPGNGISVAQLRTVEEEVRHERRRQLAEPLRGAVLGQTGVGKSALVNALFGANLPTGAGPPVTKRPEPVEVAAASGQPMIFYDMPGLGESEAADRTYLDWYLDCLRQCDVVLWAVHADSRATTLDSASLLGLLHAVPPEQRAGLLGKVTFVMTKADLITPPPWVFAIEGGAGSFAPGRRLSDLLDVKAAYLEESLLGPVAPWLHSTTFHGGSLPATDDLDRLTGAAGRWYRDRQLVRYEGHVTAELHERLITRYPRHTELFDRLRDNHRVLACSSRYRYQLVRVLAVLVDKLGFGAVGRFARAVAAVEQLSMIPVPELGALQPFVVWDTAARERLFDLTEAIAGRAGGKAGRYR